ncbi:hypothetical protein KOI35_30785 [Actinoplanes bogorensis]|uniref:Uncharacterized protein n=1 Tax=Paractinoplanes bogorensis TaxID=1610840 RepID=A0ABS5YX54_9ACTN|nr:hypothetical protein [Actinoplanes bogorensis]MBU2667906.1 hypothetical protein [Actinoplanes bogorensis]
MLESFRTQVMHNATVFGDDEPDLWHVFHLRPNEPTWRVDDRGIPRVRFFFYRTRVDRPDGFKGGYLVCDTEFYVPDDKRALITAALQTQVDAIAQTRGVPSRPVQLRDIALTDATCQANLIGADNTFFERITNPGRPSRFGRRVSSWSFEISEHGAAVVNAALRGDGASLFQIVYNVRWFGALPPLTVTASFDAAKFYTFTEDIDAEWHFWAEDKYRRSVSSRLEQSESTKIVIHREGLPRNDENDKAVEKVKEWAQKSLEDTIGRRMVLQMAPPSDGDRKPPDGIEDSHLDFHQSQVDSFTINYTEKATVEELDTVPSTLPALSALVDANGQAIDPDKFIDLIDANHEFFRTVRVNVQMGTDFSDLPVHSVEARLDYAGEPMLLIDSDGPAGDIDGEYRFTGTDEVARFIAPLAPGVKTYDFSYKVNYRGGGVPFETRPTPMPLSDAIQTIEVSDAGILDIAVIAGDIDFTQVASVRVTLRYADPAAGVAAFENAFEIDREHRLHRWQRVISATRNQPYFYRVKFTLADGREFVTKEKDGTTDELYIDDVFVNRRVSVRARGDLTHDVDQIHLDLTYRDEADDYVVTRSVALNAGNPFFDWIFPVITGADGVLSYTGLIVFRSGREEEIADPRVAVSTITVGPPPPGELEVEVIPDWLDFPLLRLVTVELKYDDDDNGIHQHKTFVFRGNSASQTFHTEIRNESRREYTWTADYFFTGGGRKTVGPKTDETRTALVLEMP